MKQNGCFTTSLATQFLSCIEHLQLTLFIHCECYQTSCKSYKRCNSPYLYTVSAIKQVARVTRGATHHIYDATPYNSITTLLQQLIFNY